MSAGTRGESLSQAITRLASTVDAAYGRLQAMAEEQALAAPAGMKWTRKEILGHLLDSASNNHQRFVRAQFQPEMTFPRYVQDQWIAAQSDEWRCLYWWHSSQQHDYFARRRLSRWV